MKVKTRRKRSVRSASEVKPVENKAKEKREAYFNLSCVLEDVSIPDQCFVVSGYFEFWWKNVFDANKKGISDWPISRVKEEVKKMFQSESRRELYNDTEIENVCRIFEENHIGGEAFMDLTDQVLVDMGIKSFGIRQLIVFEKDAILHAAKRHESDAHGYALDVDHLEAPLNWEDMFYNATSEEFLTEPFHRLLTSEHNKRPKGEKDLKIQDSEEVIAGVYHFRATLLESMNLKEFPFDKQFLDLRITCDKEGEFKWNRSRPEEWVPETSTDTVILGNDNNQIFQVRLSEKLQCVYELHDPIVDFITDPDVIQLRIRVARKATYYFSGVFFPIFFIVNAAFCSWGIEYYSTDRMGISVTMFLVVVAYQYVVSDMLPLTDENTYMNYYVLFSFFMMTLLVFGNALSYFWNNGNMTIHGTPYAGKEDIYEQVKYIDDRFNGILVCIWFFSHLYGYVRYVMGDLSSDWPARLNEREGTESEIWLPNREGVETLFLEKEDGKYIVEDADKNNKTEDTQWREDYVENN